MREIEKYTNRKYLGIVKYMKIDVCNTWYAQETVLVASLERLAKYRYRFRERHSPT